MRIYAFNASVDRGLHGLTIDHTGGNLPLLVDNGQWLYWKEFDLAAGQPHIAVNPDKALAEIAATGFCLVRSNMSTTTYIRRR